MNPNQPRGVAGFGVDCHTRAGIMAGMLGPLRAWRRECSGHVRWLGALPLLLACSHEGDYFDDAPGRARAGAGSGAVGATSTGGNAGAAAGGTSGRVGSAGQGEGSGAGGTSQGGDGGRSGSGSGASSGSSTTGGAGGTTGSSSGGTGGTAGDAGDVGSGGTGAAPCVPSTERCDGVSNDCDDLVDEDEVCPAGCSAKQRDGHIYLLCVSADETGQRDYAAASSFCESAGTELDLGVTLALARIESAEESVFARAWADQAAPVGGMVWIGANDIDDENTWAWGRGSDAEQFFTGRPQGGGMPYLDRYNDFADGRPGDADNANEDCGAMDSELAWQWDDLVCGTPRLGELCESVP